MESNQDSISLPLLPYRFRYAGFVLIVIGFFATYLYFWGGRPRFFEIPVLAVVTSYLETRWFVVAQTNALDELAFLSYLFGLLFIGFSREKNEDSIITALRARSIFYSTYVAAALWALAYLTVFGWPIIAVSAVTFAAFLIVHITLFRFMMIRHRKKEFTSVINHSGVT
ncbi:MAG: hypothetical protein EA391_00305 [Balneolaceae bacterium]|nr:MAG: hypothetical protein EA391_00305 [Balneolaceae bacterium]